MPLRTASALLVLAALAAGQRPNLVVIVTDDQRADALGCAGHPVVRTPHLDALAARGQRFTNAFVTTAICAASRAQLIELTPLRRTLLANALSANSAFTID